LARVIYLTVCCRSQSLTATLGNRDSATKAGSDKHNQILHQVTTGDIAAYDAADSVEAKSEEEHARYEQNFLQQRESREEERDHHEEVMIQPPSTLYRPWMCRCCSFRRRQS
jgi:hypothetical protein